MFQEAPMLTRSLSFVALAVVVLLVGCATPRPDLKCAACVAFDAPLAAGTSYGGAAQPPGTVVLNSAIGAMSVENFRQASGASTFNQARVVAATGGAPGNQVLNVNNIALRFALGAPAREVRFDYVDLGGVENFSVNGAPVTVGNLDALPTVVNGVSVAVLTTPILNAGGVQIGRAGQVRMSGSINEFVIGGQEFFLDDVCVVR
jgi:hypothetical protein